MKRDRVPRLQVPESCCVTGLLVVLLVCFGAMAPLAHSQHVDFVITQGPANAVGCIQRSWGVDCSNKYGGSSRYGNTGNMYGSTLGTMMGNLLGGILSDSLFGTTAATFEAEQQCRLQEERIRQQIAHEEAERRRQQEAEERRREEAKHRELMGSLKGVPEGAPLLLGGGPQGAPGEPLLKSGDESLRASLSGFGETIADHVRNLREVCSTLQKKAELWNDQLKNYRQQLSLVYGAQHEQEALREQAVRGLISEAGGSVNAMYDVGVSWLGRRGVLDEHDPIIGGVIRLRRVYSGIESGAKVMSANDLADFGIAALDHAGAWAPSFAESGRIATAFANVSGPVGLIAHIGYGAGYATLYAKTVQNGAEIEEARRVVDTQSWMRAENRVRLQACQERLAQAELDLKQYNNRMLAFGISLK